jgi:hypothetical protein
MNVLGFQWAASPACTELEQVIVRGVSSLVKSPSGNMISFMGQLSVMYFCRVLSTPYQQLATDC